MLYLIGYFYTSLHTLSNIPHMFGADQVNIYTQWTNAMYNAKYNGWSFWMLVTDNYPNYDGFAISCGSDACRLLARQAQRLSALP
jgi:hypothetical protein